jgi:TatA/E family protein of Tat protein translocase
MRGYERHPIPRQRPLKHPSGGDLRGTAHGTRLESARLLSNTRRRGGVMLAEIASPEIILVIAVVILFLFGGSKIPELARSLGRAKKEFEEASRSDEEESTDSADSAAAQPEPQLPPAGGDESSTTR